AQISQIGHSFQRRGDGTPAHLNLTVASGLPITRRSQVQLSSLPRRAGFSGSSRQGPGDGRKVQREVTGRQCRRGIVAGQSRGSWSILSVALGALLLGCAALAAQEPIRLSRNIPGDSKPIILHADNITTWSDAGQRIILLRGKVLVEQGVLN